MDMVHQLTGGVLSLKPAKDNGVLVDGNVDELARYVLGIFAQKGKTNGLEVILDLSEKKFLNSSGLSQMVKFKDSLIDKGVQLVIRNASTRVVSLVDMVGLNNFFIIE